MGLLLMGGDLLLLGGALRQQISGGLCSPWAACAAALSVRPPGPVPLPYPNLMFPAGDMATATAKALAGLGAAKLQSLLSVSAAIAAKDAARYRNWNKADERQAACLMAGDGYIGLRFDAEDDALDAEQVAWAQAHLRILSGLYGALRPCDLIKPHRLEMGTKVAGAPLATGHGSLPDHWAASGVLSALIDEAASAQVPQGTNPEVRPVLVQLASDEYWKCCDRALADCADESTRPRAVLVKFVGAAIHVRVLVGEGGFDLYCATRLPPADPPIPSFLIFSHRKRARGSLARHMIQLCSTDTADMALWTGSAECGKWELTSHAQDAAGGAGYTKKGGAEQWEFRRTGDWPGTGVKNKKPAVSALKAKGGVGKKQ